MQILRFGDNTDDGRNSVHLTEETSIALCLYPNKDGYARWKKGPVSISYENKRLFCSYKNGSIAAMCDSDGNGSVMDTHGKNVLLLTSKRKSCDNVACAKLMDPKSSRYNALAEYREGENHNNNRPSIE